MKRISMAATVSVWALFPSVGYSADKPPAQPREERRPHTQNQAYVWGGLGFGLSYLHSVADNVSLGGQVSMQIQDGVDYLNSYLISEDNTEYHYELECSLTTTSAMLQLAWLSQHSEGFLLSGLVGMTQARSTMSGKRDYEELGTLDLVDSVSLSQTLTATGFSAGVQVGYLWTFESGFSLGLLANMLATQAEFAMFDRPTPKAVHDSDAFKDVQSSLNKDLSASSAGLVLGFAF